MSQDRIALGEDILPRDRDALLVGRVWLEAAGGPVPVLIRDGHLHDLSGLCPTLSGLFELEDLAGRLSAGSGFPDLGPLAPLLAAGGPDHLLAPCDLQAVKAAGVTFADSMVERVIEERAGGDKARAERLRAELSDALGGSLRGIVPGSAEAARLADTLRARGMWSQYLEVGIGPDAEIFTKAQPMAAVGCGAGIGIAAGSTWNNPEPEVVLAVSSTGRIVGATLGNDVNLRDVEGRSALLLGKAKDNTGACAIGPFVRLFDAGFGLAEVARAQVSLRVEGADGFVMEGTSDMARISRAPADLVAQTLNADHQYPDGFVLFLGTLFAPTQDRGAPGMGFTHAPGDVVRIASPALGALVNRVQRCADLPPWTFGTRALMENLARRGLLGPAGGA